MDSIDPCVGYVAAGATFFATANAASRFVVPASVHSCERKSAVWKFKNVAISLLHAIITGIWAPLVFYMEPATRSDLIFAFSHSAHLLISFSIGYFIYDFVDMFLYHKKRSSYELMVHHVCVVTCFSVAVIMRLYLPFATLALIVEINSVFLHIRQLMIICAWPKHTVHYRNVALANVATFALCRILLLGWMVRWVILNRENVPAVFFCLAITGLFVILVMNSVYLYRILVSDFFQATAGKGRKRHENGFHPVCKDVSWIVKSLFQGSDEAREDAKTE